MNLVERHVINEHHPYFKECDELAFKSKNLYNAMLYCIRQSFIFQKVTPSYNELSRKFTHRNKPEYRALPAKVSKGTMRLVDKNMKSFFKLVKLKQNGSYDKPVKLPKYLDKSRGRQIVHYEKGALSFKRKPGFIHLSQTDIYIKSNQPDASIQFVRIVPKGNHYVIEVGYRVTAKPMKEDNHRYAAVDLGINNLMAISSNVIRPFIINGKPLKSINQYYNKVISEAKSKLPNNQHTSKRIQSLYNRRYNKINDYLHKASRYLVNHLVSNQINTLVIGYNPGWKQDTRMGRRVNQNFVSIPYRRLIDLLEYKCKLEGIHVVTQEESYTSKCSFLDNEVVERHEEYMGKRVQRGLFRSKNSKLINADINGSLNILRKGLKEAWNDQLWSDCVGVCSTPNIVKIKTFL